MTEEERKKARAAIALLKAMSEGDDEEEDKRAKAALAALELDGDEPEPKEKPPSEEDKRKASEAAAQKAAAEKKASDDEEAKRAAAQKSAEEGDKCKDAVNATVISLAKRVQELEADKQRDAQAKEQAERARLLAGLVPDVQKALKDVPLESLRGVVAALPKVPGAVSVRASVAAQFPGSTRGEGQHGGDEPIGMLTNMSGHGPELDRAMGLEPTDNPVQWKGTRLSTRAMTRREAKTVLAGLAASEKSAAERVA